MKKIRVSTLILMLLVFGLTSTLSPFKMVSASPSPDLKDYTMILDSGYSWIEISETGTLLDLRDDETELIALSFAFSFYDRTFEEVYVSSNGFLSFVSPNAEWQNVEFPSSLHYNHYKIAPFWDDLNPSDNNGGGDVYVQSFPTEGYWVVEWKDIWHYTRSHENYVAGTFQVILFESGNIVFNYEYMEHVTNPDWFDGYTCGLNYGKDPEFFNSYTGLFNGLSEFSILFTQSDFIPATVDFDPDTLNRKSQGNWVTVYIELPEGFDVNDIDISTVLLNGEVPAEEQPTEIGDYDDDGIPDLMVKFDRLATIEAIGPGQTVDIMITGELTDGTPLEGSDEIRALFGG